MANSHTKRTTPSASRNITGIVDTYASPVTGSSLPEYSRRLYDPIPSSTAYTNTSTSSSPSPSPYPLPDSRRANLHQQYSNSTHSGYLDRAQLFGRTPIQRNARRTRPPSTSNLRNIRKRSSRTPTGEWAEAGLPEPPIEASRVSADNAEGLICTPSGITTLGVGEDTPGRFSPKATEPNRRKTETARSKTSPAEDALREQFEKGRVELARNLASRTSPNAKAKWAGSIQDKSREGYVSHETPLNRSYGEEEEEKEFGYVDPASVRDGLARVEARQATGRTQTPSDHVHRLSDRDGPSESYFDVDAPRRSQHALSADPSDRHMALPKLPDRSVFSRSRQPVRLLPSIKTPTRQVHPSPANDRTELSFSPIVTAINLTPRPAGQDLAITPMTTAYLHVSSIITTISQPPTLPHNRTGLTFSQAIAIIYGCMAITASHQALLGLGGDIAAMDLVMGLYGAFLVGLAICVALQVLLGAGMRRVLGDVLWAGMGVCT